MRRLAVLLVIGTGLIAGCSGGADTASPGSGGGRAAEDAYGESAPAAGGSASAGGGGAVPGSDIPAVGPTVIKTADVEVEVEADGFAAAMPQVTQLAVKHGGFVVSSTRHGEEARSGIVTFRIPADRFEAALDEIRSIGHVTEETVGGQDVGQEFVDLEARLRNLQAQETVLLRLFDDAASVADTIRIQNELSGVQLDVEQIEGRLRYLRDQTSLATITVALAEEGVSAPGRFAGAFGDAIDGLLAILAGLVVFLGYALPLTLLGLLLWLGWRRATRATGASRPSAPG